MNQIVDMNGLKRRALSKRTYHRGYSQPFEKFHQKVYNEAHLEDC